MIGENAMRDWQPILFLFIASIGGGVVGWLSAPLLVDGFADLLRPITAACGVTIGLLVGFLIAREVFAEKKDSGTGDADP